MTTWTPLGFIGLLDAIDEVGRALCGRGRKRNDDATTAKDATNRLRGLLAPPLPMVRAWWIRGDGRTGEIDAAMWLSRYADHTLQSGNLVLDLHQQVEGRGRGLLPYRVIIDAEALRSALEPRRREASRRVSPAELRAWYSRYVDENRAAPPSRAADIAAAKAQFGNRVTEPLVRSVRKELAPLEWQRQGRRKG